MEKLAFEFIATGISVHSRGSLTEVSGTQVRIQRNLINSFRFGARSIWNMPNRPEGLGGRVPRWDILKNRLAWRKNSSLDGSGRV